MPAAYNMVSFVSYKIADVALDQINITPWPLKSYPSIF